MKKQNLAANFLLLLALIVAGGASSASAQRDQFDPKLLIPKLEWKSYNVRPDKDAAGKLYNLVTLSVTNWSVFSDDFFAPSPDLEACGLNASAPRTWLEIYDLQTNTRYWTSCAIKKSEDLKSFPFNIPKENIPTCVYIVLNDRKNDRKFKSNAVRTDGSKEKCEIKKP